MQSIYKKGIYLKMNQKQIESAIKQEGFQPFLFSNAPGYRYEPHFHPQQKLLVFLEGGMKVRVGDKWYECSAGDRLLIPGNQEHEAIVGEEGCTFFWSSVKCKVKNNKLKTLNPKL